MNNHELLGQSMLDSGNEFGPGTAYGDYQLHNYQLYNFGTHGTCSVSISALQG